MIYFAIAFVSLVGLGFCTIFALGLWPMPPEDVQESDPTFDRPFDWTRD